MDVLAEDVAPYRDSLHCRESSRCENAIPLAWTKSAYDKKFIKNQEKILVSHKCSQQLVSEEFAN